MYRSTTPLPPIEQVVTSTEREFTNAPQDKIPSTEASTESTVTIPFREPRVLSKFRQKSVDDDQQINIKPTIVKHRTLTPFKQPDKLTTTRVRESTVSPTLAFRSRGNKEGLFL